MCDAYLTCVSLLPPGRTLYLIIHTLIYPLFSYDRSSRRGTEIIHSLIYPLFSKAWRSRRLTESIHSLIYPLFSDGWRSWRGTESIHSLIYPLFSEGWRSRRGTESQEFLLDRSSLLLTGESFTSGDIIMENLNKNLNNHKVTYIS